MSEEVAGVEGTVSEGEKPTVQAHLEMALQAASEQEMKTSELLGLFFYYAHSIAENYREQAVRDAAGPQGPGSA
jgi:hypothetical protein